jgi:hypothetical protein
MTLLTKEALLRHPNRKRVRVVLPGRGEIIITEMSGLDVAQSINRARSLESDDQEGQLRHMLFVAERTVIAEDGSRIFSDGELEQSDWSIKEAETVYRAAFNLVKPSAEGNLEISQSGSSHAA